MDKDANNPIEKFLSQFKQKELVEIPIEQLLNQDLVLLLSRHWFSFAVLFPQIQVHMINIKYSQVPSSEKVAMVLEALHSSEEPILVSDFTEKVLKTLERDKLLQSDKLFGETKTSKPSASLVKNNEGKIPFMELGDINKENLIGRGSFGMVYTTIWKASGANVAVKKILSDVKTEILKAEISEVRALRHPNLVTIYGWSEDPNGDHYIIMELVENGDLRKFLEKQKKPFAKMTWLNLFKQMALAVNFLHSRKIIHRDIKSSNFLMTKNLDLKLCDFGTVAFTSSTVATISNYGTARYRAPETFGKEVTWSPLSDVYSLALVFLEVITLNVPWKKLDDINVALVIIRGEKEPIPSYVPSKLQTLIDNMRASNYLDRPRAVQVIRELELFGALKEFQDTKILVQDEVPSSKKSLKSKVLDVFSNFGKKKKEKGRKNDNKEEVDIFEYLPIIEEQDITIDAIIGAGAFSKVYSATAWNSTTVAVKMLKTIELSESLKEEILIHSKLRHPNIGSFLGIHKTEWNLFVVMEYLSQALKIHIERMFSEYPLDINWIFPLIKDTVRGVCYLHSMEVIHGDLALRNLRFDHGVVKIIDFGLARLSKTVKEITVFAIKWTAPEVIESKRNSKESDIWSLAVTIWECFAKGKPPFEQMANRDVAIEVMKGLRLARPEACSDEFYKILLSCWSEVDKRPTAKELYKKIESISKEGPAPIVSEYNPVTNRLYSVKGGGGEEEEEPYLI